jgi:hypothetical protein
MLCSSLYINSVRLQQLMRKAALLQLLHALLQLLHTLLQRLRKAGGALQRFSEMCYGVQVCYERLY